MSASAGAATGNLLSNPGAETDQGSPQGFSDIDVSSWDETGAFTAIQYGARGFPRTGPGNEAHGGANLFSGGPRSPISSGSQVVPVPGSLTAILDQGGISARLSADLGGYRSQRDNTVVTATFLNVLGSPLGSMSIGPVTRADRGGQTMLVPRQATATAPGGTRSVRVTQTMTRKVGKYNDGYSDNVSLEVGTPAELLPPPVLGKTANVVLVSGAVRVRAPGSNDFHTLEAGESIPIGSIVDTSSGRVALTTATKTGGTQSADFYGDRFKVAQGTRRSLTTLTLQGMIGPCASSRGRMPRRSGGGLWGNGSGHFSTSGHYGSASVRGTIWFTRDQCDGTYFLVQEGVVTVRDFTRHRTLQLHAGEDYLAAAKAGHRPH